MRLYESPNTEMYILPQTNLAQIPTYIIMSRFTPDFCRFCIAISSEQYIRLSPIPELMVNVCYLSYIMVCS